MLGTLVLRLGDFFEFGFSTAAHREIGPSRPELPGFVLADQILSAGIAHATNDTPMVRYSGPSEASGRGSQSSTYT